MGDFVEGDGAVAGVVNVGREREGFVGGTDGACDPDFAAGVAGVGVGGVAREPCGGAVEFGDPVLEVVVGLRDTCAVEGVGLDDVRTGFEVGAVDTGDDVWAGDDEQVVVAFKVGGMCSKLRVIAEVFLAELVLLDHGAHGPVEDDDALGEKLAEAVSFGSFVF